MISNTLLESVMIPIAGLFIILDAEDVDRVMEHNWSGALAGQYPQARIGDRVVLLHRFLVDAPDHLLVDHINCQTWDNRKENLRLATHSQNSGNSRKRSGCTSEYKGVSLAVRPNRTYWKASIRKDGKTRHLGYFDDEKDAARAYDRAAREVFGEYARINFND